MESEPSDSRDRRDQDQLWISPRTGRAVSGAAGKPYHDRLFALPAFLCGEGSVLPGDVLAGFKLTGYFLERHVYGPRNIALPQSRVMLEQALARLA